MQPALHPGLAADLDVNLIHHVIKLAEVPP
jgi:hypothetical protein